MANLITTDELIGLAPGLARLPGPALTMLVGAASRAVERHCRRSFARDAEIVEALNGRFKPRLFLSRPPINAIASIEVDGETLDPDGPDFVIERADWGIVRRGNGRGDPRFGRRWPEGAGRIVVTYDGGFDPIPDDVKLATIQQAKYLHDAAKASGRYASERLGDYGYSLNPAAMGGGQTNLSTAAAELLVPFVLHGFGD
jgi:hypothetical protein